MSGLSKITVERNQKVLLELVSKAGNDVCADCKARSPRWASWNLGIFICVNCASIHRKIGTHVTKVKSVTMDSWTKEQVENMRQNGNTKSNSIYNPNEVKHPPPPNTVDPERDSELELYIRDKYEFKRFFDRNALVASKLGPSRSASSIKSPSSPVFPKTSLSHDPPRSATTRPSAITPSISAPSVPPPAPAGGPAPSHRPLTAPPPRTSSSTVNGQSGGVWNDLISLQSGTSSNANVPLQVLSPEAQMHAQTLGLGGPQVSAMQSAFGGSSFNPGQQMSPAMTGMGMAPMNNGGLSPTNPYFQMQQQQQIQMMQMQQQSFPPSTNPFANMNGGAFSTQFPQQQMPNYAAAQPLSQAQAQPGYLQSQATYMSGSPQPQFAPGTSPQMPFQPSHFGSSPSPFQNGQSPSPQMAGMMDQPQANMGPSATNYTGWMQGPQQTNGQWGTM